MKPRYNSTMETIALAVIALLVGVIGTAVGAHYLAHTEDAHKHARDTARIAYGASKFASPAERTRIGKYIIRPVTLSIPMPKGAVAPISADLPIARLGTAIKALTPDMVRAQAVVASFDNSLAIAADGAVVAVGPQESVKSDIHADNWRSAIAIMQANADLRRGRPLGS